MRKYTNLFSQKIHEKLRAKKLHENPTFYLVPVLWGTKNELESVIDFYEKEKPNFHAAFQNTTTPACFISYIYESGEVIHKFGAIDGILK